MPERNLIISDFAVSIYSKLTFLLYHLSNEAETIEITLKDKLANLRVILTYTVFENYDAITRSCKVINDSNEEVDILRILSTSVDFRHSDFDLIQLSGSWARERHIVRLMD